MEKSFFLILSLIIVIFIRGGTRQPQSIEKSKKPGLGHSPFSALQSTIPRKKLMIKYQIFTRALEIAKWKLERNKGQECADLDWEISMFSTKRDITKSVKKEKHHQCIQIFMILRKVLLHYKI